MEIGQSYNDHTSFEAYDYIEEPPFVHPMYHFNKYIGVLRKIQSLPKFKKGNIDLKKGLSSYNKIGSFYIRFNNSK